MANKVSPCPCWSHSSSWPGSLKLFLCYRGKKNLLQIQCLFISPAASLPVESGSFWMGPTVGIGSWKFSILTGALGQSCPHLMVTPHSPCLTDMNSWRPQHFEKELVSLPAAAVPSSRRPEALERRKTLSQHWGCSPFSGRMTPGKRGEAVEGMEIPVLALRAGMALGIPHHGALSLSQCWWCVQWHCCLWCKGNAYMRQRGVQTCWQRALQAHTWVKIGRASELLVLCLICYPKAFLQNYHSHKPGKVRNSLPVLCYDNDNTADIFN